MEISKMAYNLVNLSPFGFAKVAVGTYVAYRVTKRVLGDAFIGSIAGYIVGGSVFKYLLTNANPDLNRIQQEKIIEIFLAFAQKVDQAWPGNLGLSTL